MDIKSYVDVQTALVFLVVFVCFIWLLQKHRNLPPGPWGFPVLGVLPRLITDRRLHLRCAEWSRVYGDVISMSMGSRTVVVLNSLEAVREAFVEQADAFSDRPNFLYLIQKVTRGKGVIAQNGEHWKQLRRFTLVTLRDLGVGKSSLEERVRQEARYVTHVLEQQNGAPYDVHDLFGNAVSNIICSVVFGKRFEYDDATFKHYLKIINFMVSRSSVQTPENFFPFLRHFHISPMEIILSKDNEVREFVRSQIAEHMTTYDPDNIRDFIDLYINTKEQDTDPNSAIDEENMFRVILDLFTAGSETTSTTLRWFLVYLVLHPDVQTRCRREIHKIIGTERIPKISDRSSLPYIEATVNEVQRMANVVPLGVPHCTSRTVQFRGHTLPKHTLVLSNLYALHHSTKYWENPERFMPERWLDAGNRIIKNEAFMPFSTGRRVCLGESLARMELFIFCTSLLQQFEFTAGNPKSPPSTDVIAGITLSPHPFTIRAVRQM